MEYYSRCPICNRELIPGNSIDEHHLKPKTFGNRNRNKNILDKDNLILLHRVCHNKIHHTFSEHDLLHHYHTLDRITEHPEIQKFVKWIQKKDPEFIDKHKDTRERKRKRKR